MSTSPFPSSPNGLEAGAVLEPPVAFARGGWRRRPLRRMLLRLLGEVRCGGAGRARGRGGPRRGGGGGGGGPAGIRLHRWRPVARMLLRGDIGLAESWRDGDWSSPDLSALLEFGIRNEAGCAGVAEPSLPAKWFGRALHRLRANTRRGSRQNIAFHYDIGNAFYAQWLDAELIYSSALYITGGETLEQAQAAKLARIVELLAPGEGARVLEIGCGWGALALALARGHGARVTGLTLSAEQLAHARRRADEEGLAAQLDLRLQDYRDVEGRYDRIVSIEMVEAVGERYWPVYFDTLRERLAPGGVAVVQAITIADAQFERYRRSPDFIQRFIFPGGMLPSVAALEAQAARAGLVIERAESFGASYAATLAEWRRRFLAAWPAIEPLGFDAAFRRLWEYYLCYCEAGFRAGRVDVGLFTLRHAPGGRG